jgi:hypothetical protein
VIASGTTVLADFVTEHSENTFPALPVREGENVFVWFARFNDPAAYERHVAALTQFSRWRDEISKGLGRPPPARAGDVETLADDALAFIKAATIFARRKSSSSRPSLLRIQFEIDFYVVVSALD